MHKFLVIAALVGVAFAALLTANQGWSNVGAVLEKAGWGIALITLVHVAQLAFTGMAWRAALRPGWECSPGVTIGLRWIRESINTMMPVAQIGGEVIGARLLTQRKVPSGLAAASIIVDLTYESVTLFVFMLMGAALYYFNGHQSAYDEAIAWGLVATLPMILAFIMLQRGGAFHRFEHFLNWLADHLPLPITARIEGLHDAIQNLYSDPKAVISGCCWHLLSWAAGTVEIWTILIFVGTPVTWQEAFILESMGQALRAAAFLVPGALGVQEGGYILFGSMFGLPSHVGLGLSLTKRVREVLLGIPGVIAWQWMEGRRLLKDPLAQTSLPTEK